MQNTFYTNFSSVEHNNNKIIYPFSPPIFQTIIDNETINFLLNEGKKLNLENNDSNFLLAGNLKYGRSFGYDKNITKTIEPKIINKAQIFLKMINMQFQSNWTEDILEKMYLEDLWINFSKKHDFNPSHIHNSFLSFVVYCSVPKEIFEIQADCNAQEAGEIVFHYGEKIFDFMYDKFLTKPFDGLMFIFPSKLKHYVPPFWADKTRISVSGNIRVK